MEAQQHLSMRDYGRVIMKRWRMVAVFGLVGLAAGYILFRTSPSAYQASSEIVTEKPSGYSIISSSSLLGPQTSTKQQQHFLETDNYQRIARALATIAPLVPVDLQDPAVLDDVSSVIQLDVMNSKYVTPARLVLYDLVPAPSLLSFQQARTLTETPTLRPQLDAIAKLEMAKSSKSKSFSLTDGWQRGSATRSDLAVRANLRALAEAVAKDTSWRDLGVTERAAVDKFSPSGELAENTSAYGPILLMAAKTLGTLADLESHAGTIKPPKPSIAEELSSAEVLTHADKILRDPFVTSLEDTPKNPIATRLGSLSVQGKIQLAGDALKAWHEKHQTKQELVWNFSGKEVADGTDIVAISLLAPSPEQARMTANAMAAVMVWEDRMVKVAEAERSVRFLTRQIGDSGTGALNDLLKAEDQLTAFRKANRLLDADTQLKSAAQQAADLEAQIGQTRASIDESRAALRKTVEQLGGTVRFNIAPTIKQNPLIDSIKGDLIKAETDLAGLRAQGYTDEWPDLMNAKARLQNLQKRLNAEIHDTVEKQYTPDPVHFALQQKAAELASTQVGLEARETAIGRLLGDMDGRFASLPKMQAEMVRYTRAYEFAVKQYSYLYERLVEAKTNRATRQGNARVVSVATDPGKKVSPRMRYVFVAFFVGIFLGCACALALASIDTKVRTADEVRRELHVPVLAHLPAIPPGDSLVVESMPASAVTEGFRALRATIRFVGGDAPLKTLVATSARSGNGKSAVVANLAASLAQAGLSITAVDADLRRPRLAAFFGLSADTGLAEALAAGKPARDAKQATRIPGLFVVPSGSTPANPGELLENGRIHTALADLSEGCDMVVVDSPPAGAVADAAIIGSAADATILVIEAGTVTPDKARAALAQLTEAARAKVIGVVLVGGDAPVSANYRRYAGEANVKSRRRSRKAQA